jgi:hypothetical protein
MDERYNPAHFVLFCYPANLRPPDGRKNIDKRHFLRFFATS